MPITRLSLPYVQAAGDGGPRTKTQLIVIHATDNPRASAEDEASYASRREDKISCHVVVDGDSAVQINMLDHVAWGCYPTGNSRSIQFELCGRSNYLSTAVIARAAKLVAQVAHSWGIPVRHLTLAQMRAGDKGIVGHGDVTKAWGEGTHTDPGDNFPWASFLSQVQAEVDRLKAAAAPKPAPPTVPTLRRQWPTYMKRGHYFGLITGPAVSHGGYYANERADVQAIQRRLIQLGYVPGIKDPKSGWADGKFEQPTKDAVARWQRAKYAKQTTRYGEVWSDDWLRLFTY